MGFSARWNLSNLLFIFLFIDFIGLTIVTRPTNHITSPLEEQCFSNNFFLRLFVLFALLSQAEAAFSGSVRSRSTPAPFGGPIYTIVPELTKQAQQLKWIPKGIKKLVFRQLIAAARRGGLAAFLYPVAVGFVSGHCLFVSL